RCLERLEQLERLRHEELARYWKEDALNEVAGKFAEREGGPKGAVGKGVWCFYIPRFSPKPGTSSAGACSERTGTAGAAPDQNPTPTQVQGVNRSTIWRCSSVSLLYSSGKVVAKVRSIRR